jgi:hypothetical protein
MLKAKPIAFTNSTDMPVLFPPEPASNNLPDWYKEADSYFGKVKKPSNEGETTATIKKCMPIFDAMSAGYILFTGVDIYVHQNNGETNYSWASQPALDFHHPAQALGHPQTYAMKNIPRWENPWIITTPKGYSTLFTQPFHRESPIRTFEAVVDTDSYYHPVEIPFTLADPTWEGLIPAGTPIVQVIPFKRESYKMEVVELDKRKANEVRYKITHQFFDRYKNHFWNKKEYR